MNKLWQDLVYGVRMLRKNPGFALIAILTLALGIGINTAIFSVVNRLLLQPLPYENAERLVMVWETFPNIGLHQNTPAPVNFLNWREHNRVFEDMAAWTTRTANLTAPGEPEQLRGVRVTAAMFPLLGVKPILGRTFLPEEDRAGGNRVVVINHDLWRRHFAADSNAIGKTVTIDNESYTLVGVMPESFEFPLSNVIFKADFWMPMAFTSEEVVSESRMLLVMARLKPGVSDKQAQAEMDTIVSAQQPGDPKKKYHFGASVISLQKELFGDLQSPLLVLLAAAGLVLLIACANVANLLLARAAARQKETGIRIALGAGRWRLVQQFLTESILLAALGGGAGLLLACWGVSFLSSIMPASIAFTKAISVDYHVLFFGLAASILTGVVCGCAPALQIFRANLNETLKESGKQTTSNRRSFTRSALVVAEVSVALILLIGGGLMIKSVWRLSQVEMGFQPQNLLTMNLTLPETKYSTPKSRTAFYDQLLPRLAALPGVESVGVINGLPVSWGGGGSTFKIEGRAEPNDNTPISTHRIINADYFRTMRIPLAEGRYFTQQDTSGSEPVAIISESLAHISWPGDQPIGRRIRWDEGPWMTIVGVVKDVRLSRRADANPHVYMPYPQVSLAPYQLALRTKIEPQALVAAVRKEVRAIDNELPVAEISTMDQILSKSISRSRFNMMLLVTFAALAGLLAAIGIYGVMSYTVAQSTREIGIRMALGAQQNDVLRLVVGQGLVLILLGLGIGFAGAFGLTRLMASLLFGVTVTDPVTFGGVSAVLMIVATLACYVPARRATKVDPLVALRYE
jgi:putative ABC transport system permease protein